MSVIITCQMGGAVVRNDIAYPLTNHAAVLTVRVSVVVVIVYSFAGMEYLGIHIVEPVLDAIVQHTPATASMRLAALLGSA